MACPVWLAWAAGTPASEWQKKVSGKQVQTRAEPPAVCSALWLSPEALVQLCCTSQWDGHLRGESGTVVLAVNVGQVHSIENVQGGVAPGPHLLPFLQCLPQDLAGCCLKHLSWSPVTKAMLKPRRSQDITKRTQGHAVWWPPYYLWTDTKPVKGKLPHSCSQSLALVPRLELRAVCTPTQGDCAGAGFFLAV